jgi:hypothetical protein
MFLGAYQKIRARLNTSGLAGCGLGIGVVFGSLLVASALNPFIRDDLFHVAMSNFNAFCETDSKSDPNQILEKVSNTPKIDNKYHYFTLLVVLGIISCTLYFLLTGDSITSNIPKVLSDISLSSEDSMSTGYKASRLKWLDERGFLPPIPKSVGEIIEK